MNPARNADLEQAIAADPDDLAAHQVHADWLLERDDPRGELIAVSLALHARPLDTDLQRREQVLQAEQAAAFLTRVGGDGDIELSWRFGLLDALRIHPDPMLEVSSHALADPVAGTVRSLEVTGWSGRDGTDALAGAAALRHLRLATGTRISSDAVAQMCAGLPRLTSIDLRGYSLEPWTGLPVVDALGVSVRVLRAGALAALLRSRVRQVSIAADALHGDWSSVLSAGIAQFLDGPDRRTLGVFHPELARAALASTRLGRLGRLGLPWEQLDDHHRARLAACRRDLATVQLFDRLGEPPWWPASGDAEQRRRAITARAWVLHRCLDRGDEAAALLRREGLDVAALERDWELALASSHHPGLPAPVASAPVVVEPDYRALRQSARRLMRERRFHEAYVFCEHAMDRAPGDAELRVRRLEAMFMNGEDISPHLLPALDMVDMLLGGEGSREDLFEWWNLKGWLCSALERWDEAEVCFRAALALDPSDEPTQARLRITAEIAASEAMFASD